MTWLAIAAGAGVGAAGRFLVDSALSGRPGRRLPWGTAVVNLAGSLALGLLAGLAVGGHVSSLTEAAVGTGFCGGLTTYSTFAWETVALAEDGAPVRALAYQVLTVLGGLLLAGAGYAAGTLA